MVKRRTGSYIATSDPGARIPERWCLEDCSSCFVCLALFRLVQVSATVSWDSSIHDSVYLNRVTPANERVYLIVKVVVRLASPLSMDLVLRKRICVKIYKRQSWKDTLLRRITRVSWDLISKKENLSALLTLAHQQIWLAAPCIDTAELSSPTTTLPGAASPIHTR